MEISELRTRIESAFADRSLLADPDTKSAVFETLRLLDTGVVRVATQDAPGKWTTHAWIKQAVLLYFGLVPMQKTQAGPLRVPRQDPAQARTSIRSACAWFRRGRCVTARSSSRA